MSEKELKDAIEIAQRSGRVYVIRTKAGGFFGVQAGTVGSQGRQGSETLGRRDRRARLLHGGGDRVGAQLLGHRARVAHQYQIAYQPTNDKYDGKFRQIEVRRRSQRPQVRTKRGYNAEPPRTMSVSSGNGRSNEQ